jgi:AraC-like DNA-binding protein
MYLWKLWFRCEGAWSSLPRLSDVQEHSLKPGIRVCGGGGRHYTQWRLLIGRSGTGVIQDPTGRRLIPPGHAALVPVSARDYAITAEAPAWRVMIATLDGDDLGGHLGAAFGPYGVVVRLPDNDPLISGLARFERRWISVQRAGTPSPSGTPVVPMSPAESFARAADLLALVARAMDSSPTDDPLVAAAQEIVSGSKRLDLSVKDLSRALRVSRKSLAEHFDRLGMPSPGRWLREARIRAASADLLVAGTSIAAVSRRHGFSNTASFARAFRRVMGLTPAAWILDRLSPTLRS